MAEPETPRDPGAGGPDERPSARGARDSRRGRDSRRAGASTRTGRSSRRRLSDEERQALWRKAVAKKSRKIKILTDLVIFLLLACVLGAHALTFAHRRVDMGGGAVVEYGPKRGYELMLDLVKIDLERTAPDASLVGLGTKLLTVKEGGALRVFEPAAPADVVSMLILVVPVGAAILFLLYLLDFLVWMGRPLPILSLLYGFGSVAYLMITRVPENGAWNFIGIGGTEAMTAWFMLLIPLFLLGAFSALRILFSARRKRYAFAGLEPPAKAAPAEAGESLPDAAEGDAEDGASLAEAGDDEPGTGAGGEPDLPHAPPEARADDDLRATPVSSPAISLEGLGAGGGEDAEAPLDDG